MKKEDDENNPEQQNQLYEEARIWSDREALNNKIPQRESSSCGKIAIINVLKALNYEFDYDFLNTNIKFNKRNETGSLEQYLFSRSIAGMNAKEVIENVSRVTNNKIIGRLFSFYPPRDINLSKWLCYWIKKGAVPVALLNLQRVSIGDYVPDAWHHQMIYGCGSDGSIYLTNPIQRKTSDLMLKELTSDSILLVRRDDIIRRYNPNNSNLIEINHHQDERWRNLNVLGQVNNVLNEHDNNNHGSNLLTHIEIPASYIPGITLFVYKDSQLCKELFEEFELPLK